MNEGIVKWYYENGSLFSEGPYHKDLEDGIFTYYSKAGKITKTETWKDGKRIKK